MSRQPSVRRAVWLAGAAAMMPVVFGNFPLAPAEAIASGQFEPPGDPMVLTRTLRRPLPGGAEVLTRRSYEIRFIAETGGYRIDGELVGVEVEAPPGLQALAMLERKRPDADMFPMRLDIRGLLQPQEAPPLTEEVRQAARSFGDAVQSLSLESFDRTQATNFAKAFEQRSVRTAWPEDLFRPVPGRREETQVIPLPNGARGTVRVIIDASTRGPTGLLSTFVRRVTTDLEGQSRITEETWTLAAKKERAIEDGSTPGLAKGLEKR
jgi:hypothetical protein